MTKLNKFWWFWGPNNVWLYSESKKVSPSIVITMPVAPRLSECLFYVILIIKNIFVQVTEMFLLNNLVYLMPLNTLCYRAKRIKKIWLFTASL